MQLCRASGFSASLIAFSQPGKESAMTADLSAHFAWRQRCSGCLGKG